MQLPVTDNVNNTVVVEGRLKRLRKLSCQLQAIWTWYTCIPAHIPHCHALRFKGFIVKHEALSLLWILIRVFFPIFTTSSAHNTLICRVSCCRSQAELWIKARNNPPVWKLCLTKDCIRGEVVSNRVEDSSAKVLRRHLICRMHAPDVWGRVFSAKMSVTLQGLIWDTWALGSVFVLCTLR